MLYEVISEKVAVLEKEEQRPVKIVVVGTGGGGSNALNNLIANSGIRGEVRCVAVNTDVKSLEKSLADTRVQIGVKTTGGQGAGGMPDIGEAAAQEDEGKIKEAMEDPDMVFIIAGMGGGTGTGSAPVIAKAAKSLGALTVGIVTTPFEFELTRRMRQAMEGIDKLREAVDTLIVIPNEKIFAIIEEETPFREACAMADDVLCQGVKGISDLIIETGYVNIDFADATTVMKGQGEALMTMGIGEGENRVNEAAARAMTNPLLEETSIKGATQILIYVSGGDNFSMVEYKKAVKIITSDIDPNANVIAGMYINPEMGDRIKITVIATGLTGDRKPPLPAVPVSEPVKPADENLSETAYQQMIEKRSGGIPYRNNSYAGVDIEMNLDLPPSRRGESHRSEGAGGFGILDKNSSN